MRYKGAIFDMDGVLFDTERIYQETWRELAEERDIKLGEGFSKDISGTNGEHMNRIIEEYFQVGDGFAVAEECRRRMKEKLEKHVPVKKGVREILEYFSEKGLHLAVASSSSRSQIEANLIKSGIRDYFMEIVSGEDVKHGKPAPDIFILAARKIGCMPEECFVFEDSANGVRAGHAAGCFTIMIPDLIEPTEEIAELSSKVYTDFLQVRKEIRLEDVSKVIS